jgi:hypothetical protein
MVYQRYFVKVGPKPPMNEQAEEWLRSQYDPDLSALEALLGHELPALRRSWPVSAGRPASFRMGDVSLNR